jgi:uncharacterized membrane protein
VVGHYALHYPITDFAVSLLVVAAFVDLLGRALERPDWRIAVDWLLFTGFAGGVAAMCTGLWLATDHDHSNPDTLSLHRWFAYSTVCTAAIALAARIFERRLPKLSVMKTAALAIAAALVCCTGYVGGRMTHSSRGNHVHTHDHDSTADPPVQSGRLQPTELAPGPHVEDPAQ